MLVKNAYVKFILKGQGIFSLDVNKILRLQVTLNSRYAKNVIRYSFLSYFFGKKISLSRRDEYVVDGSMDQ